MWDSRLKKRKMTFEFNEHWLGKILPLPNVYLDEEPFFASVEDICQETKLSKPLKVLALRHSTFATYRNYKGRWIRTMVVQAMLDNQKCIELYIPHYQSEMLHLVQRLLADHDIVISSLKVMFEKYKSLVLVGLIWDLSLSGVAIIPRKEKEKVYFDASPLMMLKSSKEIEYLKSKLHLSFSN